MDPAEFKIVIQIGTILVALAGGWMMIKVNLKTAQRDLLDLGARLHEFQVDLNARVDIIEQDKSVIKRQTEVFANILSPAALEKVHFDRGVLSQRVDSLERAVGNLSDMHNHTHPPTSARTD